MSRRRIVDELKTGFWFLPALSLVVSVAAGLLLPNLDAALEPNLPMIPPGDQVESARDTMSTIATVTASVGGLAFSVTLVTVALGGQLYSPRVVRAFRGNRLYQATLGAFIGTFVYSLLVLISMSERPPFVPELSVALAILATVLSFGLFTAFLTDLVRSTEAETVVRRLAQSGQEALENRWPRGVGSEGDPFRETRDRAHKGEPGEPAIARSPRSGFLLSIDGEAVIESAREGDGLVVQRTPIGDFVVTGQVIAEIWAPADVRDELCARVVEATEFGQQRTVVQDVAFPVRQLADVALRGLSPSLNDFTSAETAMGAVTDILVCLAREPEVSRVRLDADGVTRLVALAPGLDDLVRLAFDQLRVQAAGDTTVTLRLLELLAQIRDGAEEHGREAGEALEQARLIDDGADLMSPAANRGAVHETYRRLFVERSRGRSVASQVGRV